MKKGKIEGIHEDSGKGVRRRVRGERKKGVKQGKGSYGGSIMRLPLTMMKTTGVRITIGSAFCERI